MAAKSISNQLLAGHSVMVKCPTGYDQSLLLAALAQIIIQPSFRTFEGFKDLVMRMFVFAGHPFATRLGERPSEKGRIPIFLKFLDSVGQLINANVSHFEFNCKYLARLANLVFTNIYGTFLCDTPL